MLFHYIFIALLTLGTITPANGEEQQTVPDDVYPGLEYALSLPQTSAALDPERLSALITFVNSTPAESGMNLKERQGADGAFYAFSIQGELTHVLDYAYNPDIPLYVTMPSSLRHHEWLTPQMINPLKNLRRHIESADSIQLLRGRDREIISPDTNTGGYYRYDQDRIVTTLPGPNGPVLISVSSQNNSSEVGKKGCIVGDDKDWNYLYSKETGLNTFGLGWVESYMYHAHSVIVYVADAKEKTIRVGSFKWLNGGWAKMNMVNSDHILNGMKRFAADFKTVLEAPGLPDVPVLENKYQELRQNSQQNLRQMVQPYLTALVNSGAAELQSNPFENLLSSGEYLQQMSHEDLVKVLLLEYVKGCIGKKPLVRLASHAQKVGASDSLY